MLDAADVLDEGGEIGLVVCVVPAVLVVPTLVPADASKLDALPRIIRKELLNIPGHLGNKIKRPVIEIAGISIRIFRHGILPNTRREEVVTDTLAAPGRLDDEDLALAGIAHRVPESKLRANLS